jgi:DNA-binding MarR family transcriptional regulator
LSRPFAPVRPKILSDSVACRTHHTFFLRKPCDIVRLNYYLDGSKEMEYRETKPSSSPFNEQRLVRGELWMRLAQAGRENSTATVLLHNAIADRVGLNATESKTLDLLSRLGPLTAGEVARHTGLATASVTSLIDSLERKEFVRRRRDALDRRRVIVEPVMEKIEAFALHMAVFSELTGELVDSYSEAEIALILDVMARVTAFMQRATERLQADQQDQ